MMHRMYGFDDVHENLTGISCWKCINDLFILTGTVVLIL
jgi:hypothetical protein